MKNACVSFVIYYTLLQLFVQVILGYSQDIALQYNLGL